MRIFAEKNSWRGLCFCACCCLKSRSKKITDRIS